MVLLSPSEAGKICGLSSSQIRRLIAKGVIKAKKVGAYYVIDKNDVKNISRKRKLSKNVCRGKE